MKNLFRRVANKISVWAGSPVVFLGALLMVAIWGFSGPRFSYSNTWQLVINTGTTIVTFLMVFLIQNTQNRDGKAMQLKLDELIRASKPARDNFLDLEDMTDEELEVLDEQFRQMHQAYQDKPPAAVHKLHKEIMAAKDSRKNK
jgi:low affinity Fe/Cu permease